MAQETSGDWDFDVIVLGTGLKECILSGLMSSEYKQKVLHMERNDYYGGEAASVNLKKLYETHRAKDTKIPEVLGAQRDYNIDLCPKFLMANGELVKVLLKMKVNNYLEFRKVMGSYVLHKNNIHKVPSTPSEGLSSGLLSFGQKYRFRQFINYVAQYDPNDAKTYQGLNLKTMTMSAFYKYWKLDTIGQTFVSHALALEADSVHLSQPAEPVVEKIKLYAYSVARFGSSPYIYPVYGLGGLPESFARLSAIHQGLFMLKSDITGITYGDDGKANGVTFNHEQVGEGVKATAKLVIGDPSYFEEKESKKTGQTARCIVIMSTPLPNTNEQGNCQIIIPNVEVGRKNDVYVSCLSNYHNVAPQARYLAVISSTVEGGDVDTTDLKACADACDRELAAALRLIPKGNVLEKFSWVTDTRAPADTAALNAKNVFMTSTMDATTHFQNATNEVLSIYKAVTGKELDTTVQPQSE